MNLYYMNPRKLKAMVTVLVLTFAVSLTADGNSETSSRVDLFKNFFDEKTVISKCIAEVCSQEGGSNSPSCYYVMVRSQANGFYYREVPRLDELYSTNIFQNLRFAGFYNDEYWNFSTDGMALQFSTNRSDSLKKTLDFVLLKSSSVLNLGLFDANPRSIVWKGNAIAPYTNLFGVSFNGTLECSATGDAVDFLLNTDFEGRQVSWKFLYFYEKTGGVPDYLLTRITAHTVGSGRSDFKFQVRLLVVEISDRPLDKEYFMAAGFSSKPPHQILYGDKGLYTRNKLEKDFKPMPQASQRPASGARYVVFSCLALSSIIAYVIFRRNNNTKTTKLNK